MKNNTIISWGIIGVGDVCEKKSGPAFSKVPNSKLVAVMRRDLEKAKDYALRHSVPKYYASADDLIADPEINAIYIATPPAFHEAYALQAIKAGKYVYIEKPVTPDAAGCKRIIAAAEKEKVAVSVAHYRRRLPLFLKLRELIENDSIGKVKVISIRMMQSIENNLVAKTQENWRIDPAISGGGIFHDLAPHQLDIIYWLFGQPVHFSGRSNNLGAPYHAPDYVCLHAEFKEKVMLDGQWCFSVDHYNMEDTCEILGDKGKIRFSFFWNQQIILRVGDEEEKMELPGPEHIQQPMIAEVVEYFRGKAENPCSLQDALWSMKMMDCTLSDSI